MTGIMLSFGHGFSGQAISRALYAQGGWEIFGTTRSLDKIGAILNSVAKPIVWPGADSMETLLDEATHLLISAAPNENGDPVLNALSDAIKARRDQFEWVGYLSTTGVYGDHQGGWVDESTRLTPSTERGKMRVAAETAWADMGLPLHIFRLAGIYGPGRGPFSKVRNGTARRIIKKNQLFSRIHVEDIAQVVLASIAQPNVGSIYNVCDDFAAPPEDVIGYAAELLGVPVPEGEDFETADMTPMARSFYSESKKVSNKKIKEELGVELKYPDYKAGLKALLAES
ncbi:SDR family oxidoreductase [Amylibacter sp. SFDW26]|uniref:SDR family oxidoreductase n=1 Tax=Amylibacter sp. SFDW26 TaxID=2652722 RepID=UPI001262262E|nr:SDR family oxidoreductase [Amylibacter sp. SFDW26]KAB7614528.1 SDR family oxidoreductase [Amylibacter sp. SFDW26]